MELEGTSGNIINLYTGGTGAEAGKLILNANVTTSGTGLNTIASFTGLGGSVAGIVDLNTGTHTFTVADTVARAPICS